ncbi:MAG: histone deacetylase [Lentisphaerae bacterium]|nr:histone deacetylase [Lentisphaerota bacterium]
MTDPSYAEHNPQSWHPECPARLQAVQEGIARVVPAERLLPIDARAATIDDLQLCHSSSYVELVQEEIAAGYGTLSTGDTDVGRMSYDVALRAVGGTLAAVDAVFAGKVKNAFCALRPPGHHASGDRGMGFCIFNNVAIAARYAQVRYGIGRVLIVDWDVHHGNGTQDIFYEDPTVFYFSSHEWPLYPGTGAPLERGQGAGKGTTMNCIFPAGTDGSDVIFAFRERLVPAMDEFEPELVLISAGFDARKDDPISNMALEDADFATLTRVVMGIADRSAHGRVVSALEGGYGLPGLASAAGQHVLALTELNGA